jgi:uncharacterized oxidoreductase
MDLSGHTILITGGTSGIGLALTSKLLQLKNTVIVTGRNQSKLDEIKKKLPKVHVFQSDVSDPIAITNLYETIIDQFPNLNFLVNNAGIMHKINLHDQSIDLKDITHEIEVNLSGPIRMIHQFLPHLKKQKNAVIMNVSSLLAFLSLYQWHQYIVLQKQRFIPTVNHFEFN